MKDSIQSIVNTPGNMASADNVSPESSPEALAVQLNAASLKQQLQLIDALTEAGQFEALLLFLKQYSGRATPAVGYGLQTLAQAAPEGINDALPALVDALVPLASDRQVDYGPLRQHLLAQAFQDADRVTLEKLCELAGAAAVERKWLYFSEVNQFPATDLITIDFLWYIFSQGKFGFSVQRELWLGVGQTWERLWPKIGWRSDTWTRYPDGFTWSLSAPRGHLPLSNQLRGVRVMAALMNHPAWNPPQP